MNVERLFDALDREAQSRAYILRLDIPETCDYDIQSSICASLRDPIYDIIKA